MARAPLDADLVRALAGLLDENNLTEIEYEAEGVRVRLGRTQTVVASAPVFAPAAGPAPAAPIEPAEHPGAVYSPMVGVVYLAAEPGQPPFVKPGDAVAEGATLLLIEAMKTFNAIRAPRSGRVARVMVADGQPVEYGEPLLVIE